MEPEREGGERLGQVHIAQLMRARPTVGVHKGAVKHPAHSAVVRHRKRRHERRKARECVNLRRHVDYPLLRPPDDATFKVVACCCFVAHSE